MQTAILRALARGPTAACDLESALGIHQALLSRMLQPLEAAGRVVRLLGRTRGARYGLARVVDNGGSAWPVYAIDAAGEAVSLGSLVAVAPRHIAVRGGPARIAGLTEGFPYFLQDARPAGFLGRVIPASHPELDLPARVQDWTNDQVLTYLTRRGADHAGNLIVGAESLQRHFSGIDAPPVVAAEDRARDYSMLASAALAGKAAGSFAHGENPKFMARLTRGDATTHVLVKFSPPRDTPAGARWADLLLAECVAAQVLGAHGVSAARSQTFEFGDRVYLETERFDRIGADGRRGAVSLHGVDVVRYGLLDDWSRCAERLHAEQLLSGEDLRRITLVDAFGGLIGNTDRHFGNITLFDDYEGPLELAPIYDMLPMLFAPQDGRLPERHFEPGGPTAATAAVWPQALDLAEIYWTRLCAQARLSEEFRRRCECCLEAVQRLGRYR